MLIILKDEREANILANILTSDDVEIIKGAITSSLTFITDAEGKYQKIEFTKENNVEVKNE